MHAITARPVYDCRRRSLRTQLWGVFAGSECIVICTTYPSWITKGFA